MIARGAISVGVLAAFAAACGGAPSSGSHPSTGAGVVPWIKSTRRLANPSPWVSPGSASAPHCTTSDLGRGTGGMQGATQMMIGGVKLTNIGRADCTLEGAPRITLIARDDTRLPVKLTRVGMFSGFGLSRWPGYPLVALRPGQAATAPFFWRNYCGHQSGPTTLRIASSAFTVTVRARGGTGTPVCEGRGSPSTLTVGTFLPGERHTPAPRPLPLRVSITAPHQARPGERMHYLVTLTNYATRAVVFHRCPAYWQGLSTDADQVTRVSRALVLNCRPTPTIPPGGHATYAMEGTIPPAATPGANALVWTFEPVGLGGGGKTLLRVV